MKVKLFLFVVLILQMNLLNAPFRTETKVLRIENLERSFEIFIPRNYHPSKDYSLVFVLHGGAGTGKKMLKYTRAQFNKLATRENFIVVYPNGIGKSWNDGARDTLAEARKQNIDDVQFFREMINHLEQKYSVNASQIFACGISNGGFMVQRLAYEMPEKIKAIAVVAANLSIVQWQKPRPEKPVSVLFINGTADPLVPYNGGHVTVFKQKRGEILSVDNSVKIWKEINNCNIKTKDIDFPDVDKSDACTAHKTCWINSKNSKIKVALVRTENGGHTWPGTNTYLPKRIIGNTNGDFNACTEIWEFFKSTK